MPKQGKPVRFLTLSLIVFLSGVFGHLLAGAGSSGVYLWPPAGVMVAVALSVSLGRLGVLPVLAGAFFAQLVFDPSLPGLKSALVSAFALLLLGFAAKWLSRPFLAHLKNNKDRDFLFWLFRAGPLASLVPAAFVALATVFLMHPAEPFSLHKLWPVFANVWLGHTLGVMLFAPILLILNRSAHIRLAEPEDTRRALAMIITMAVVVVVVNFFLVKLETQRLQRSQQLLVNQTEAGNFQAISQAWSAIESVRYYVYASQEVTPQEFEEYTGYTSRFPAVESLAWVPLSQSGTLPSDPEIQRLLERSAREDRILAVPVPGSAAGQSGKQLLFVAAPVNTRDGTLRGYVVARLNVHVLIQPIADTARTLGMSIVVTDVSDATHPVSVVQTGPLDPGSLLTNTFSFGGRTWQIQMASADLAQQVQQSEIVWLFRLLSVLIVLVATALILANLGRTVAVLRAVRARTLELEERLSHQLEAETALRQNEADLNVTLRLLGEAVITTDAQGNVVRMNRVAEQLTDWPQSQSLGERASAVFCIQNGVNPMDGEPTPYPVTEALSHKATVLSPAPVWMVARNGSRHRVRYIAAPLFDKKRRVRGAVLVFRGVSDEESLHAKTTADEKRFRSIIESTPTAIATLRGDTIEFINPRMRKLLGVSRHDGHDRILGTAIGQWVSAADQQLLSEFRSQDEEHHRTGELEVTLKRYDSEEVHVRVSVGILDRETDHHFLLFKEVGDGYSDRFDPNGFFNLSPDLICMADSSGYLQQVNPAFLQALGWSRRELLSQPLLHFVHPEDAEVTRKEVALLQAGEKVRSFVNRCQSKSGHYVWLQWKARIAHRGVVFAIARDVTEQMELVQKLQSENNRLARDLRLKEFALNTRHNSGPQ